VTEADGKARAAAEAVARPSYGKLVAFLATRTRDVAAAEDALADAFAAALADWPANGIPGNPEGWLVTAARRRLVDAVRRRQTAAAGEPHLTLIADELEEAMAEGGAIPDERLRLMFACAHPAIDEAVRAPLILQTVLGFDAATVGSAFLVAPAAMGQRLVRAKAKIREAGIPFRVPDPEELAPRLEAVLDAIYAAFAEGWTDAVGTDTRRRALSDEALWLGRLVAHLLPGEPEALGLVALMLHAEARRGARRGASGEYVPLAVQDTRLWNVPMIEEAETLLRHAAGQDRPGRYQIEAAIQSAHVVRRRTGSADWQAIVRLYDVLIALTGSPVAAVNRAVALAETDGPSAGIAALEALGGDRRLTEYQPYWAARADLLARVGRPGDATEAYAHAIGLEPDPAVRDFLARRRAGLASGPH
jgi:RNA polymerase sigma-70 factor (ECF subfamily)